MARCSRILNLDSQLSLKQTMSQETLGYTRFSIAVHWLTAVLVIALFFTHEGERGSAMQWFHVSFGALAGVFLLWRIWWRLSRGPAPKVDQHPMLNLLSDGVRWGILVCIAGLVITGYLLPWSVARSIDFSGLFSIPSPLSASRGFHEFLEEAHDILGHLIIPLVLLHIAGALKHHFINRDGVLKRMMLGDTTGR